MPLRFRLLLCRRRHSSIDFLAILYLQLGAVSHILSTKGHSHGASFCAVRRCQLRSCADVIFLQFIPFPRDRISAVHFSPKPVEWCCPICPWLCLSGNIPNGRPQFDPSMSDAVQPIKAARSFRVGQSINFQLTNLHFLSHLESVVLWEHSRTPSALRRRGLGSLSGAN